MGRGISEDLSGLLVSNEAFQGRLLPVDFPHRFLRTDGVQPLCCRSFAVISCKWHKGMHAQLLILPTAEYTAHTVPRRMSNMSVEVEAKAKFLSLTHVRGS